MNVMSPGCASRMPATPAMTVAPSPTSSASSSCASSASVRLNIGPSVSWLAGIGFLVQLADDFRAQVQAAIRVDDHAAGGVQHEIEPFIACHLLDHGADAVHDLAGRALVLLRCASLGSPNVLNERLVILNCLLQRLFLLLPPQGRQDGSLIAYLGPPRVASLLLLGRLVAPVLHLPVELRLRFLCSLVVLKDLGGIDESDTGVRAERGRSRDQRHGQHQAADRNPLSNP